MNLKKDDFGGMIEHGALIGGLAMMGFIGWYVSDYCDRHQKNRPEKPVYNAVAPQKIKHQEIKLQENSRQKD